MSTMRGRKEIPPGPEGPFSIPQAAQLAGLSYGIVSHWARTGLVTPTVRSAGGRGTWRQFGFADLVALRVAGELRQHGIPTQSIRRIVQRLPKPALVHPLAKHRLVVWGTDVLLVEGEAHWSMRHKPGQGVLVALLPLVEKLRADVAKVARRVA